MAPPIVLLKKRCRKCKRELIGSHFVDGRKSCRTCLEGLPYPPADAVLVVSRPRVRRKWPAFVRAHAPAKSYDGPCITCGVDIERTRKNQRFCSTKCKTEHFNWLLVQSKIKERKRRQVQDRKEREAAFAEYDAEAERLNAGLEPEKEDADV